jgi:hypothetical protein
VNVREFVAITGNDVRLDNGESVHDANADRVGEAFEISHVTLTF